MNKVVDSNIKKIIAREILLFFGSVISAFIIYLLIYPCNYYCITKLNQIDKLITLKTAQIDSLFDNSFIDMRDDYQKECKFHSEWNEKIIEKKLKIQSDNYLKMVKGDKSTDNKNTYIPSEIYNRSFKEYVLRSGKRELDYLIGDSGPNHKTWLKINVIDKEKDKLQIEQSKWEKWEHITSSDDFQKKLAIYSFFIFLIIIYPLKLLVWSINTINHKGD